MAPRCVLRGLCKACGCENKLLTRPCTHFLCCGSSACLGRLQYGYSREVRGACCCGADIALRHVVLGIVNDPLERPLPLAPTRREILYQLSPYQQSVIGQVRISSWACMCMPCHAWLFPQLAALVFVAGLQERPQHLLALYEDGACMQRLERLVLWARGRGACMHRIAQHNVSSMCYADMACVTGHAVNPCRKGGVWRLQRLCTSAPLSKYTGRAGNRAGKNSACRRKLWEAAGTRVRVPHRVPSPASSGQLRSTGRL